MTHHIQITSHDGGRYRYTMALVDEQGEIRHQQHYFTDAETVTNVDLLIRMGFALADTSEDIYQQLARKQDLH